MLVLIILNNMKNDTPDSLNTPESKFSLLINILVRSKIELIRNYLWKYDKDMDDQIDMQEMLNFFDSNLPDGKKYDRALAEKIFSLFDSDSSGKISIDEFIKTFIHIDEELKMHKAQLQLKYQSEKDKLEELQRKVNMYRSESLNSEGIGPNSVLNVEIVNVEFLDKISNFNSVKVKLQFNGSTSETNSVGVTSSELVWNEKFTL